jgi:broad-specificity NMP kinase
LTYSKIADIEIDTTNLSPNEVSNSIFEKIKEIEKGEKHNKG